MRNNLHTLKEVLSKNSSARIIDKQLMDKSIGELIAMREDEPGGAPVMVCPGEAVVIFLKDLRTWEQDATG